MEFLCLAQKFDKIYLQVEMDNLPAINLYKKLNFKEYGRTSYVDILFKSRKYIIMEKVLQ